MKAGYTLLEVLIACALAAVLFAVALPASSRLSGYANRTKSLSNMRQIGVAAHLYADDHNQQLPGQPATGALGISGVSAPPQWPALLCSYLSPSNPVVFLDPGDTSTARLSIQDILSNATNHTGYIYNGFDELAVNGQPPATVYLSRLPNQSNVVLLAQKKQGATAFCIDPLFQPVSNLLDLLDPGAYQGGSHYLFVDGSVRYLKSDDYSNGLWSVDKNLPLPLPTLPPLPRGAPGFAGPFEAGLPLATVW